jgi:hypothetical protein
MEPICQAFRARIRFARGDDGARDDCARAVEHAQASDPQVRGSALSSHAFVLLALGDRDGASRAASATLAVPAYFYAVHDLAIVLHDLGRGDELDGWIEGEGLGGSWEEAARAIALGDFHAAAEIIAPTGNVADEAYARLRSGLEDDVRRALDFYRSVGATRYVREGEALLAATA